MRTLVLLVWVVLAASAPLATGAEGARTLVVAQGGGGAFGSIADALGAARDGDTIEVHGGIHPGGLVVERSVRLVGIARPIIDGGGAGTVVRIAAPNVSMTGFVVRGSGLLPDRNDAGIAITAPNVTVERNEIRDVLDGVFVSQAPGAIVRENDITGEGELEIGRKGDAIRVWYSNDASIEDNHVHDARDVVLWYSSGAHLTGNVIERGRYGVHLMYCNDLLIRQNRFVQDSVGLFIMYSHGVHIEQNVVRGSRGPSGYAIGARDTDDFHVVLNVLSDNRVGVYLDHVPYSPGSISEIRDNILASNDVGALIQPSAEGNVLAGNSFYENVQQVEAPGSVRSLANVWTGNYWSDALGLDLDGNGVLDSPYHADHVVEGLAAREPRLKLLLLTPIAAALETGITMFPIVATEPILEDASPRSDPAPVPPYALGPPVPVAPALAVAAAGVLVAATGAFVPRVAAGPAAAGSGPALRVRIRRASYGRTVVLRDVAFDAEPGETIALWGENGSGKTTLLRAMLGLVRCSGEVSVTRAQIGYVPQEPPRHEWSVRTTLEHYAALRGVSAAEADGIARESGLETIASMPVTALSGGQRQRLALALARLGSPRVLLLDEPTANLDEASRAEHVRLVQELHGRGRIVLFATHHVEEVVALADRVLVVEGGRIAHDLTPREFCDRMALHDEVTLRVGRSSLDEARAALAGAGVEFTVGAQR